MGKVQNRRLYLSTMPDSRLGCVVATGEVVGVLLTRFYRHMGRKTVPSGGVLQEMTARHATAKPVIGRLRHKFFNKTETERCSKLLVGNSLILSRDLFGVGA